MSRCYLGYSDEDYIKLISFNHTLGARHRAVEYVCLAGFQSCFDMIKECFVFFLFLYNSNICPAHHIPEVCNFTFDFTETYNCGEKCIF